MKTNKNEKGQILMIFVGAIIALFAFTALAIDGSTVYNQRRQDQAAADSAALAYAYKISKAGFTCTSGSFLSSASYTAPANVTMTIAGCTSSTADIQAAVTSKVKTYFLQVVPGAQSLTTTNVKATARVTMVTGVYAGGNAIYATGQNCSEFDSSTPYAGGGIFSVGNSIISVTSGGLYSASCLSSGG